MLKSLKNKMNRLEQKIGSRVGVAVIHVGPGETAEGAAEKHFAQNPKDEQAEIRVFFHIPAPPSDQDDHDGMIVPRTKVICRY